MRGSLPLQDTPDLLKGRTHFSTGQCCRKGVVTDGDGLLCVVHIHLLKAEISEHTACCEKKCTGDQLLSLLTAPCANAPITTAAGPSGTTVRGQTASPAEKEVHMRGQPGGRWSDTGFLIILRSFWEPSAALTLSLCNSWTEKVKDRVRVAQIMTTATTATWCSLNTERSKTLAVYPWGHRSEGRFLGCGFVGWFLSRHFSLCECKPATGLPCSAGCPSTWADTEKMKTFVKGELQINICSFWTLESVF